MAITNIFFSFAVQTIKKQTQSKKERTMTKPYAVGIDIGGTNTVFGIVDKHGTIIKKGSIKTQENKEVDVYVDVLTTELKKLIDSTGLYEQIAGIGIGAPNANYFMGTIEEPANLPWKGVIPFAKMISEKMGLPTFLTNDANAAAIGEMTYGATRGIKDFIMITLGTGVGSGIVINGQMVYGHDGFAGELGHVTVERGGRLCGCGKKGCLEAYTSATGVARTAREYVEKYGSETLLSKVSLEEITSKDVYDAAIAGDKVALEIFEYTGTILGEALANFATFSSPKMFVLFGGLAKSGDMIMNPIRKAMEDNLMGTFKGKISIVLSQLKESDVAVLGASALGWEGNK